MPKLHRNGVKHYGKIADRLSYLEAVNAALNSRNDADSITCFIC